MKKMMLAAMAAGLLMASTVLFADGNFDINQHLLTMKIERTDANITQAEKKVQLFLHVDKNSAEIISASKNETPISDDDIR